MATSFPSAPHSLLAAVSAPHAAAALADRPPLQAHPLPLTPQQQLLLAHRLAPPGHGVFVAPPVAKQLIACAHRIAPRSLQYYSSDSGGFPTPLPRNLSQGPGMARDTASATKAADRTTALLYLGAAADLQQLDQLADQGLLIVESRDLQQDFLPQLANALAAETACVRVLAWSAQHQTATFQLLRRPAPTVKFDLETGQSLAQTLKELGQVADACRLLEDLLQEHPGWLQGYLLRSLWHTGDTATLALLETAQPHFDAKGDPSLSRGLKLRQAKCLQSLGRRDAARQIVDAVLAETPDQVPFLDLKGHLAMADTHYEAAAAAFEHAHILTGDARHLRDLQNAQTLCEIRPEFRHMQFSSLVIQHLVDNRTFETVLDIGSGAGDQAKILRQHGKTVTELDYGGSIYFEQQSPEDASGSVIIGDFLEVEFQQTFDCVLASHVLEHQLNVSQFLKKVHAVLREGGTLAISVPPLKHEIVGGHVSLWNAGLLLYNLVLAGFDCRQAWVRRYGYNISLAVQKKTITPTDLVYDNGDINRIRQWLPEGLSEGFNGDIRALN